MAYPLDGIRVVALEQAVAAPLCTRHLADLGADVVKVERPDGGDFARRYDSSVRGQATYFVWLNRGKRSVALDLKSESDREVLLALLGRADVFVHNLGPGAVERLDLGWDELHRRWPGLIDCAISGYGLDGPYRDLKAFDLLLQGESGIITVTGTPDEMAKVGISIADISAGTYALSAILAALHERARTGVGRLIDISMLECLAEWMMVPAYQHLYAGTDPLRAGTRHATIVPYGPFRVADGWVNLAVQTDGQWQRFCQMVLECPDFVDDARFSSNEARVRHRAALEASIERTLAGLPRSVVVQRLTAADVPVGTLNDLAGLLAHPQLAARDRWFDAESPGGTIRALEHPLNLVGMARLRGAVPALGEHTESVRQELGVDVESSDPE